MRKPVKPVREMSDQISTSAVAEILGVTPATVLEMANRGELPHKRTDGGPRMFSKRELEKLLKDGRIRRMRARRASAVTYAAPERSKPVAAEGDTLTVGQASQFLGISTAGIIKAAKRGKLPHWRVWHGDQQRYMFSRRALIAARAKPVKHVVEPLVPEDPDVMSTSEAAKYLGTTHDALIQLARRGTVPHWRRKHGEQFRYFFSRRELAGWIARSSERPRRREHYRQQIRDAFARLHRTLLGVGPHIERIEKLLDASDVALQYELTEAKTLVEDLKFKIDVLLNATPIELRLDWVRSLVEAFKPRFAERAGSPSNSPESAPPARPDDRRRTGKGRRGRASPGRA